MGLRRNLAIVASLGVALGAGACGSTAPTTLVQVSSPAMVPTFKVGQLVTVILDRSYVPRTGDIIAFHPPTGADAAIPGCGDRDQGSGHPQACDRPTSQQSRQIFVKRVVATPGDVIRIVNGHVYRNGSREDDASYTEACGGGSGCNFPSPIRIPAGEYFVLGDNRGASDDSRFWGPVPRNWIIGKVK